MRETPHNKLRGALVVLQICYLTVDEWMVCEYSH